MPGIMIPGGHLTQKLLTKVSSLFVTNEHSQIPSVSSRRNWSEVTVSPSPAFLAKNQLASDGPDSIKPVVIPALTTMLDSSLVEDMSLCPVRALKVYLDKTKSMRKGKALLFVSLR